MSRDPARARFAAINLARLAGVALVLVGMLAANGKIGLARPFPYVLLGLGLFLVFLVPAWLIRRWRTPPE